MNSGFKNFTFSIDVHLIILNDNATTMGNVFTNFTSIILFMYISIKTQIARNI